MPSSRGSPWPRDRTHVSCGYRIVGRFFTVEPPEKPWSFYFLVWLPFAWNIFFLPIKLKWIFCPAYRWILVSCLSVFVFYPLKFQVPHNDRGSHHDQAFAFCSAWSSFIPYSPSHIFSDFWNNHVLFPVILFPLYQPGKLLCASAFSVKTECLEICRFFLYDRIFFVW